MQNAARFGYKHRTIHVADVKINVVPYIQTSKPLFFTLLLFRVQHPEKLWQKDRIMERSRTQRTRARKQGAIYLPGTS